MRDTKKTDGMNHQIPDSGFLGGLEAAFGGRFEARPGNLTGSRLDLFAPSHSVELPPEVVVAELLFDGSKRATLDSGGGTLVLDGGSNPSVSSEDETILRATRDGAADLDVSYLGSGYRVKLKPVRNAGVARSGGTEVCRVKGSLFGRSYTADFREGMFPVAVFVLWQTALLRRRSFTAGGRG